MESKSRRLCESAGIGRQARLRGVCQPTWEFDSPLSHQLVASDISLVTSFFISLQSSSRAHSAAPRFQIEPASLGYDLGKRGLFQ